MELHSPTRVIRECEWSPGFRVGSSRALRLREGALRDGLVAAGFYRQDFERLLARGERGYVFRRNRHALSVSPCRRDGDLKVADDDLVSNDVDRFIGKIGRRSGNLVPADDERVAI